MKALASSAAFSGVGRCPQRRDVLTFELTRRGQKGSKCTSAEGEKEGMEACAVPNLKVLGMAF